MSIRKPQGTQVDTITRFAPQVQESFDLNRLDAFVTSLGVDFVHYRATPSPVGKNDRGDLRRNDGVDTITSNGMIYTKAGIFTGTITDNNRSQKRGASGVLDPSEAHLVLPRFYNQLVTPGAASPADGVAQGERIYLMPGDRVYLGDPQANVLVANSQLMDYQEEMDNVPMFPIISLQDKILDSRNIQYTQGVDFEITQQGNVRWLATGQNPGIDPDTAKGRVYTIRYLYKAYYYVVALPKEVRITNVTTGDARVPERMAYSAVIVREYIFHNQNRGDKANLNVPKTPARVDAAPRESIEPNKYVFSVDMTTIDGSGDE
jgi:hypothetical protein